MQGIFLWIQALDLPNGARLVASIVLLQWRIANQSLAKNIWNFGWRRSRKNVSRAKHVLSPSAALRINSVGGTPRFWETQKKENPNIEIRNPKQIQMIEKLQCFKLNGNDPDILVLDFPDLKFIYLWVCFGFRYSNFGFYFHIHPGMRLLFFSKCPILVIPA